MCQLTVLWGTIWKEKWKSELCVDFPGENTPTMASRCQCDIIQLQESWILTTSSRSPQPQAPLPALVGIPKSVAVAQDLPSTRCLAVAVIWISRLIWCPAGITFHSSAHERKEKESGLSRECGLRKEEFEFRIVWQRKQGTSCWEGFRLRLGIYDNIKKNKTK